MVGVNRLDGSGDGEVGYRVQRGIVLPSEIKAIWFGVLLYGLIEGVCERV